MHQLSNVSDQWSAFVATLVNRTAPSIDLSNVFDALGTAGLYVMSEEWWDPSTIDLHPRMAKKPVFALLTLRQRQLLRLRHLGVQVSLTWHASVDSDLVERINTTSERGGMVGLYGIAGTQHVHVHSLHDNVLSLLRDDGTVDTADVAVLRFPGGLQCVSCEISNPVQTRVYEHVSWVYELLFSTPSVAFDTPAHPIRDWQVWHFGADAFAVAAFSAETAAPLAIVSDNVVRILKVFDWRIRWLHHQLQRTQHRAAHQSLPHAMSVCEDVAFYLDILLKQYQLGAQRRSLSLADGALIAEACRDIRQAFLLLKTYLDDVIS